MADDEVAIPRAVGGAVRTRDDPMRNVKFTEDVLDEHVRSILDEPREGFPPEYRTLRTLIDSGLFAIYLFYSSGSVHVRPITFNGSNGVREPRPDGVKGTWKRGVLTGPNFTFLKERFLCRAVGFITIELASFKVYSNAYQVCLRLKRHASSTLPLGARLWIRDVTPYKTRLNARSLEDDDSRYSIGITFARITRSHFDLPEDDDRRWRMSINDVELELHQ